jgi:uncharacterized protein YndB with AHSA1/START domain
VCFPQFFASSAPDVWALLVEPERLSAWSPFTSDRDLSRVGRATLTMLDAGNAASPDIASVVFVADRNHTLEYSWADDTVRWTLEHDASTGGTRLVLRQTLADETMASAIAAGWHLCLQVAESVTSGHPIPPIRGMAAMDHGWSELNLRYAKLMDVSPSKVG